MNTTVRQSLHAKSILVVWQLTCRSLVFHQTGNSEGECLEMIQTKTQPVTMLVDSKWAGFDLIKRGGQWNRAAISAIIHHAGTKGENWDQICEQQQLT